MEEKKVKERRVAVELSLHSKVALNPEQTLIPVMLLADRLIMRYMPPGEKFENTNLFRPIGEEEKNLVTGDIVSIGDDEDPNLRIPAKLKTIGLICRYAKGYAETFEYDFNDGEGKKICHMIRASEVAYIL